MRAKRGFVNEAGRAITADRLALGPHVDEDMRMIERRRRPRAHELLHADLDGLDAGVVVEMGHRMIRHGERILFAGDERLKAFSQRKRKGGRRGGRWPAGL